MAKRKRGRKGMELTLLFDRFHKVLHHDLRIFFPRVLEKRKDLEIYIGKNKSVKKRNQKAKCEKKRKETNPLL